MIKANASSVISNLGGGQHGHLGLVVPDAEYNQITGYTYTKPTHPGQLKIKENTPLHKAIIMQESNNEKLNLFCEINAIESAIKSQIVTAINPMYFNELKNNSTATIEHTIARMVMHFFQQYGQVPYHQLQEELKVRNFVYNISDPPIIRFNAIEDLLNLSKAVNIKNCSNK